MNNTFAGMSSHQSAASKTDTWFTPRPIIEACGGADSFDLDPCSHSARPWPTARHHFTEADNGLLRAWWGRVWLNPPYSNPVLGRFLARMAVHGCGMALIFARTETDAFFAHVWEAATGLLFLRGRLNFCYADGGMAKANSGAPSVLIAYGARDRDILAAVPIDGHFVPLRLEASILGRMLPGTWREMVEDYLMASDGPVHLSELYRAFARHPRARVNRHYEAKIRQVLQRGRFERVDKGVWRRAA